IGEAVREDEQQAVGGAGFGLENFAGMADTGTEARVTGWLELVEPRSTAGTEALGEGLEGEEVDSGSALRTEPVDGDPVAELLEGNGQGGSGASLVVVDGKAVRIGLGGGTGGVKEDEDAEVARKLAAFQVDVFGRGVAGMQVDEQVDEGVDVEVVAILSATDDLGTEPQASQASAEQLVVLNTGSREIRRRD
ncbi:MAG TPA: hypothetical protein VEH82_05095, partial [Acidimicrobiales bacterium]|nr:hypothetical protein [Acidimicrobiales bacterium]